MIRLLNSFEADTKLSWNSHLGIHFFSVPKTRLSRPKSPLCESYSASKTICIKHGKICDWCSCSKLIMRSNFVSDWGSQGHLKFSPSNHEINLIRPKQIVIFIPTMIELCRCHKLTKSMPIAILAGMGAPPGGEEGGSLPRPAPQKWSKTRGGCRAI